jgi:putative ABC transport system permease protein
MPDWKAVVRERLAGLNLNGAREAEIIEELAQDLEDRYGELRAGGVAEAEARLLAQEVLGQSELLAKELHRRDCSHFEPAAPFSGLRHDLRLAFRNIRSRPMFSFLVIGMLTLGIAGNAAIFSIFNGMFLRPLPFRESSRLVDLDETAPKWNLKYVGISDADLFVWRKQNSTFDAMAFFQHQDFNLSGFGAAKRIHGAGVTLDMLRTLALQPVLGRNFTPQEDSPHGAKVVLLSYNLWQQLFHGSRDVLGRVVKLSGEPHEVIGVLPRETVFPDQVELWIPLAIGPNDGRGWYLSGIGRLKAGVSIEQARADLLRVHRAMFLAGRKENEITSPIIAPLRDRYLGDFRIVSNVLLGAVAIVLLIACVNIAALMMVRGSGRMREIAIRTAIGASRGRVIRQLLTENLVTATLGGIGGMALGYVFLRGLLALMPADEMPRWLSFGMDMRFAAFCILITGGATVLFGLLPALQAASVDAGACLQETGTRVSLSRGSRRTLSGLVVGEIGLALMLLISAALLLQAFRKVLHVDPGFRPQNVITFGIDLPEVNYGKPERRLAFFHDLLEQLRGIPGVQAVGAASAPPLGGHWGNVFEAEGARPLGPRDENPVVLQVVTTPGYFDAIGMSFLTGRPFDEHDNVLRVGPDGETAISGPLVAIVSETFARRYWPVQNVVGKRIRHGAKAPWITVTGVIKDEKHYGLDQEMRPAVYFPYGEAPFLAMSIVLRGYADPQTLLGPSRDVLRRIDPGLPVYDVRTMSDRLDESMWARRAYSWLLSAFALVALALAAAGIYGVISYAVSRRTHEIGIRMALGARPDQVLRAIVGSGMTLVAIGVAGGLAATLLAVRVLETLLFGVSPRDPLTYAGVILGVSAVCLLANFVPARRAAAVDPMRALRTE